MGKKEIKDMDTNDFVQLSDNVNSKNRSCAISFGKADEKIIDEIRARIMNNTVSRKDSSVTNCRDELIDALGLKVFNLMDEVPGCQY